MFIAKCLRNTYNRKSTRDLVAESAAGGAHSMRINSAAIYMKLFERGVEAGRWGSTEK